MRLVKFYLSKKKEVYVNPDLVTTVVPYSDKNTIIHFVDNNSTVVVLHDVEYVISKLIEDSE
jgi:hypothetical protein